MKTCGFVRDKYGRELLVDAGWIRDLEGFIRNEEPHTLSFYDITLLTGGEGSFDLDGRRYPVEPGRLLFTTPGQVRKWNAASLEGICLFFTDEFFREFFNDPLFLHRLHFFHGGPADPTLRVEGENRERMLALFDSMTSEIRSMRVDADHALRADLYGLLVRLNREFAEGHQLTERRELTPMIARFRQLVESQFSTGRRLSDYARELGVSPGHLSALTRRYLGVPAGAVIRNRLLVEAKRRLLYTDATAERIASDLGFGDAAYFSRFFKRGTGRTPTQFRAGVP